MSTEVASTRLPKEILREIDREASSRGMSRSVYLAALIEQRALGAPAGNGSDHLETVTRALVAELRELREGYRALAQGLREIRAAIETGGPPATSAPRSPLIERLTFSTFFSEALLKRVSSALYRSPSELGQVVREAREQAEAEAKLWRERVQGNQEPKGAS
jgi:hypothetical protein